MTDTESYWDRAPHPQGQPLPPFKEHEPSIVETVVDTVTNVIQHLNPLHKEPRL